MAGIHNFFKLLFSKKTFNAAEAESKLWDFTCDCGHEFSIWDIGGIRYKAKGNPVKHTKCPACNKKAMRKLFKRENRL